MDGETRSAIISTAKWYSMPAADYEVDRLKEVNKELKRAIFYLMVRLWLLESEEKENV